MREIQIKHCSATDDILEAPLCDDCWEGVFIKMQHLVEVAGALAESGMAPETAFRKAMALDPGMEAGN